MATAQEFWLFGYGLIWKPPPHYDLRVPGYIKGYVRRFWQASEDHRGTPASPGRVVTLIERAYWEKLGEKSNKQQVDEVYGAAYRIPQLHVEEVKKYLDIREINGYSIQYTTFFPCNTASTADRGFTSRTGRSLDLPANEKTQPILDCLVYIGLPNNPQFLGLQDPRDVAKVIATRQGPSGRNDEYLFMLKSALEELGVQDDHVDDLVKQVKTVGHHTGNVQAEATGHEIKRVLSDESGDTLEETDKTIVACSTGD